jgi:predicted Rossmann fold flavoprotein
MGSTLCTHTGLSGPATLDISRYWLVSRDTDPGARLLLDWLPEIPEAHVEQMLLENGAKGAISVLRKHLTERLAQHLCAAAAAPPTGDLPREARRRLVAAVKGLELPVVGDRGFTIAEATAGGVPLAEVRLDTMESRICPGLHFAGEVLDVDGRIGGFNFQWAWASGFVAGSAAGR